MHRPILFSFFPLKIYYVYSLLFLSEVSFPLFLSFSLSSLTRLSLSAEDFSFLSLSLLGLSSVFFFADIPSFSIDRFLSFLLPFSSFLDLEEDEDRPLLFDLLLNFSPFFKVETFLFSDLLWLLLLLLLVNLDLWSNFLLRLLLPFGLCFLSLDSFFSSPITLLLLALLVSFVFSLCSDFFLFFLFFSTDFALELSDSDEDEELDDEDELDELLSWI